MGDLQRSAHGNGTRRDDFVRNSGMFHRALEEYYGPRGYGLILNGDIEELYKFKLRQIRAAWERTYDIFGEFHGTGRLVKTVGNHDSRLLLDLKDHYPYPVDTVLAFTGLRYPILIYHGHQVSAYYERFNDISRFGVRYFALPLGIMNRSVAHHDRRRNSIERRIYEFSRSKRIVSLIGHTHRPLFESLSKPEQLRFRIEYLLARYRKASEKRRQSIKVEITALRSQLMEWRSRTHRNDLPSGIYATNDVPVPCLFNSGTVVGKRGMTCLELADGKIRLVRWFASADEDAGRPERETTTLVGGEVHRQEIRQASVEYVMDSLNLLV
ncbi:MAG: metallophosphoesterase [Spirochaetota bacterium]